MLRAPHRFSDQMKRQLLRKPLRISLVLIGFAALAGQLSGKPPAQPGAHEAHVAADPLPGASASYEQRKAWLMNLFRDRIQFHSNPKCGLPVALAKLYLTKGEDRTALEYCAGVMDFKSSYDRGKDGVIYGELFTYPGLARFLYMYGDQLTAEQLQHLKSQLLIRAHDLLSHGTENHAIMRVASGYLICQYFPGEIWTDAAGKTRTSEEMMAEQKKLLLKRGQGFFRAGNNEVLSSTYIVPNVYPLLSLYDFAKDPEVRNVGEALTLYHLSELAVNDFDGFVIPPFNRENCQQEKHGAPPGSPGSRYAPVAQYLMWLYWRQNQPLAEDLALGAEPPFDVQLALSNWTPPPVINRIATGEGVPYAVRSSIPSFGHWGTGLPDETLRSVWRDRDFAIGATAMQRLCPDQFFLDYDLFGIVWSSQHRFNYLECYQPYWRSNSGEETWTHGVTSPFQQMAHHKNTAIILFNIPKEDPWARRGEARFTTLRDKHYEQLLQVAQCRFPKTVDELIVDDDWYFLREGDVYIGIRVLRPGSILKTDLLGGGVDDFNVIKSYAATTGFLFEVGTRQARGDFNSFRAKLKTNPLSIDWNKLQAKYRNTDGDQIEMQYNTDLSENSDHEAKIAAQVKINNVPLDLATWPLTESPEVNLKNSVLEIGQSPDRILVDWRQDTPKITHAAGPRK